MIDETPSLLNDARFGASCPEQGFTLVTRDSDFKRLESFLKGLCYAGPWPLARPLKIRREPPR